MCPTELTRCSTPSFLNQHLVTLMHQRLRQSLPSTPLTDTTTTFRMSYATVLIFLPLTSAATHHSRAMYYMIVSSLSSILAESTSISETLYFCDHPDGCRLYDAAFVGTYGRFRNHLRPGCSASIVTTRSLHVPQETWVMISCTTTHAPKQPTKIVCFRLISHCLRVTIDHGTGLYCLAHSETSSSSSPRRLHLTAP